MATGRAKVTRVLGFGGVSTQALVFDAKQNLYQNFTLKEGQVLANTTVDFKRGYYIFWENTIVTVSGEIIEFTMANADSLNATEKARLVEVDTLNAKYHIGQEVFVQFQYEFIKAQIVDLDDNKVIVRFVDKKEKTRFKSKKSKNLFVLQNDTTLTHYQINETVRVPPLYVSDSYNNDGTIKRFRKAKIIGLGTKKALVELIDKESKPQLLIDFTYEELRPLKK